VPIRVRKLMLAAMTAATNLRVHN